MSTPRPRSTAACSAGRSDVSPPGQPRFVMADSTGMTVAGIGAPFEGTSGPVWNTYVSVRGRGRDGREGRGRRRHGRRGAVRRRAGGPDGGLRRPRGRAVPRLAAGEHDRRRNSSTRPGSWNWSDLETRDIDAAKAFYGAVFDWEFNEVDLGQGPSAMIRVPGYGEHLDVARRRARSRATSRWARPRASRTRSAGCSRPPVRTAPRAGSSRSRSPTPTRPPPARSELGGTVLVEPFDVPYVRMAVAARPGRRDVRDRAVQAAGRTEPRARRGPRERRVWRGRGRGRVGACAGRVATRSRGRRGRRVSVCRGRGGSRGGRPGPWCGCGAWRRSRGRGPCGAVARRSARASPRSRVGGGARRPSGAAARVEPVRPVAGARSAQRGRAGALAWRCALLALRARRSRARIAACRPVLAAAIASPRRWTGMRRPALVRTRRRARRPARPLATGSRRGAPTRGQR